MKFMPIIFIAAIPTFVWADDLYTNNITGGCGDAYYYNAEFEPINYTCSANQFLPAGAISCQSCPQTHTCNGGTFTFNANQTQGLSDGDILVTDAIGSCSTQFNQSFSAIFEPITYTCSAGYYLPADGISCTECLENYYCPGGQLTFNETTPQGLNACPNDTPYAPVGSTSVNQCYKVINLQWYLDENATTPLTVQPATQKCIYAQHITLPDTNPTKPGYIFSGWRLRTTPAQQQTE